MSQTHGRRARPARDPARLAAHRRRNDLVGPEHLLAAIIDDDLVEKAIRRRGLDADELRERLGARLGARTTAAGYRDAAEAALSPTFEGVIERVTPSSWLHGPYPTVLDALLLEP